MSSLSGYVEKMVSADEQERNYAAEEIGYLNSAECAGARGAVGKGRRRGACATPYSRL